MTTSPAREMSVSSSSNSLRESSSGSPCRVAVRVRGSTTRSATTYGLASPLLPPRRSPDPGRHLLDAERLHDVVVSTPVERSDDDPVVVLRGDHQHRHLGDAAQHGQHLHPVDVGEPQVEEHHVRPLLDHHLQGREACAGAQDGHAALAETSDQAGADRGVILDHQDADHGGTLRQDGARSWASATDAGEEERHE